MKNLTYLQESFSTNDDILLLLKKDKQKIIAAYTFDQKKGRGQYGNSWESKKNLNIAFSIAVPSNFINIPDSLFNFYTALQLRDFIATLTKDTVMIKWPNDLILNKKKIAGILIEKIIHQSENYFIIGFGLNVLQKDFDSFPNASSLIKETAIHYDLHSLSENLFDYLLENIVSNIEGKPLLQQYESHLFRKNAISVFEINEMRQNGIIKSVDAQGFLEIDLEMDGLKKFNNKEIKLLY
ncbi:biotin--[acetyl-CoA-carboxylase] ligase [Frigoriflavimonas asaccharolytica]|uniref:BirA family biotin operon repressor/biotin-[acetyl-CoA-carboxylase] ligase n=1 Tax=Frigoriflavimonas asaccharolytica TaxID=2735899 RepID=A0A8J8G588_9FLAO|nr:biotin--[acetyl-CoA-carboxylase] ligase [Frigoriflavimonas asaccharolytica]NRS90980.1 BirA family biotin operon repressor/biotin-[acetyl-CoA-carboxylase] ligase [Frigoriflavimonas asaccharolytica]